MADTSNRVAGTLVAEADLPQSKARMIFDRGTYMTSVVHKRVEDILDYFIDLARWLEPDETIIACEAYTGPTAPEILVVQRLQYAPTGVVLWLKDGGDNVRYSVFCRVITNQGKRKLFEFSMLTNGDPDNNALLTEDGRRILTEDGERVEI